MKNLQFPLVTSHQDEHCLNGLFASSSKLYNNILSEHLKRVKFKKLDPNWKLLATKQQHLNSLKIENNKLKKINQEPSDIEQKYDEIEIQIKELNNDVKSIGQDLNTKHHVYLRSSTNRNNSLEQFAMNETKKCPVFYNIHSTIAKNIAKNVFGNKDIYNKSKRHFKSTKNPLKTIKSDKYHATQPIYFDNGVCFVKAKRKGHFQDKSKSFNTLHLNINENTKKNDPYYEYVLNNKEKIKSCQLKRIKFKSKYKYFLALIIDDEEPFTKIKNPAIGDVFIDVGIGNIFVACPEKNFYSVFTFFEKENDKRILQRKADRQRRKSNSAKYNENGTIKKKLKRTKWKRTKNYLKTMNKISELYRKTRMRRSEIANIHAKFIVENLGSNIIIENNPIKSWARNKRWAKKMTQSNIGYFISRLEQISTVTKLETHLALSQRCPACGDRKKKSLKMRIHECDQCGFTMQRDFNTTLCMAALTENYNHDLKHGKNIIDIQKFAQLWTENTCNAMKDYIKSNVDHPLITKYCWGSKEEINKVLNYLENKSMSK